MNAGTERRVSQYPNKVCSEAGNSIHHVFSKMGPVETH